MEKAIWVLLQDHNLPFQNGESSNDDELRDTRVRAYTSFERAREDMKTLVHEFATSDNGLFDGNGGIVGFQAYVDNWNEDFEVEDLESAQAVPRAFKEWIMDMDGFDASSIPECHSTDYLLGIASSSERIVVGGIDDGPCNGIDPIVWVNMFDMSDPDANYYFCIRNAFGWGINDPRYDEDKPYYIDIQLTKVELDEGLDPDGDLAASHATHCKTIPTAASILGIW